MTVKRRIHEARGGRLSMSVQIRSLLRNEFQELDRRAAQECGLATSILMENAGRGAAGWLAELTGAIPAMAGGRPFSPLPIGNTADPALGPALSKVLILCGPGNNGGDGAVVARHLSAWGFPIRVVWLLPGDQLRGAAAAQWEILHKSGIEQSSWFNSSSEGAPEVNSKALAPVLATADWLVDGLLGTGLSRPVMDPLRTVIEVMNCSGKPIFALDLPSGLDADTGQPLGIAVRACTTATFVAPKVGFASASAGDYIGKVAIIDIGLPRYLLEPYLKSPGTEDLTARASMVC
jgi:NAD(P)H-hydrate epimerase